VREGAGRDVVGRFKSRGMGGSLLVSCHRGFLMSRSKAMGEAREAAEAAIEGASPVKVRRVEMGGQEVPVTQYQGTEEGAPMAAVTLTIKTGRCWLNLLGTAPARNGDELEEQLIGIAASAK
jgi:hypothetical protein